MARNRSNVKLQSGKWRKRVVIVVLAGTLLVQPITATLPGGFSILRIESAHAAVDVNSALKLKDQTYIAAGTKRLDYVWHTTRGNTKIETDVHVIEVDLTNPYVSLNAMSGQQNSVGQVNSTIAMARENGAIAAINGDVYAMNSEGAPLGGLVTSGSMLSSPARLIGMNAFTISKDRKPMIDSYVFDGKVTAMDGAVFPLDGINKSAYSPETIASNFSHVDQLYMYTSAWGGAERPRNSSTTPTEVLVRGGLITEISLDQAIAGSVPEDGYILRAHGQAANFVKEHLQVGQAINLDYALISDTTGQRIDPSSFEMMIGGHTLLVNAGAAAPFSRDISGVSGNANVSRTGVGYSQDGTKVYLITAERDGTNTGVNLKELQQIMLQLGVFKGTNLDGGGSTTMIERPLGEFNLKLAHPTQSGTTQRRVSNGIGVFTNAPQGTLQGIKMSGPEVMFVGQKANLSLKGHDNFYNPVVMESAPIEWSSTNAIGVLNGFEFTAEQAGKTTITAASGQASASHDIEIVGRDQVAALSIRTPVGNLAQDAVTSVPLTLTLKNGKSYNISGDAVQWEFIGFTAERSGDSITVKSVSSGTTTGYAIARYDGFPAMIPFTQGEITKTLEDFEISRYSISSQVTPAEVGGNTAVVTNLPDQLSPRALRLDYDFTNGTGTKASYANFKEPTGITLSDSPAAMTMDVYSDNSGNWVRAEISDADGNVHLLDVAKQLDWTGWKNVKVDLASANIKFPAKLKRIYVVTIEGQNTQAKVGTIGFDNLKLQYPPQPAVSTDTKIEMHVSKASATVNGEATKLDSAPFQKDGVTYVPVRFISDAMGGKLLFDGATGRITIMRGDRMMEMTINQPDYIVNGVLEPSELTPIVRNNRTLIPVRLFSEKLGLYVVYDAGTKKITIS